MDVTRSLVLNEIVGGLWHTTLPERFARILSTGGIAPNPELSDNERWKTARGPHFHSYVRTINAVSLFDFKDFNPEAYSEKFPLSSWAYFIPCSLQWESAVWIEIDRAQIAPNFICASEVVSRWKADSAYRHTIMPYIEAAHVGVLPCKAFLRAFEVGKGAIQIRWLALPETD